MLLFAQVRQCTLTVSRSQVLNCRKVSHSDVFMESQAGRIDERDDPDAWMSYGN